jgi:hypothetical protein
MPRSFQALGALLGPPELGYLQDGHQKPRLGARRALAGADLQQKHPAPLPAVQGPALAELAFAGVQGAVH